MIISFADVDAGFVRVLAFGSDAGFGSTFLRGFGTGFASSGFVTVLILTGFASSVSVGCDFGLALLVDAAVAELTGRRGAGLLAAPEAEGTVFFWALV